MTPEPTFRTPFPVGQMPATIEWWDDNARVKIELSDADRERIEKLGQNRGHVRVQDLTTGEAFLYSRAACGLGCFCSAQITWDQRALNEIAFTQQRRWIIWEGEQITPNGRGVHCDVHVYEYESDPVRYEIFVGGWRVATLKTKAGAIRRAEREVARV